MVAEFVIIRTIKGFFWKPINAQAHFLCKASSRVNLSEKQISLYRQAGVVIKAEGEVYECNHTS